jgi:threonyl-tRNA synthetase
MAAVKPGDFGPLETMRHSAAHLLAAAVMRMFPDAKLGVGPVIENGFYYDMLLPRPLTTEDFAALEKAVRDLKAENHEFRREEMPLGDAIKFFRKRGQDFKVELLQDLQKHGTTSIKDEDAQDVDAAKPDVASVYWTGDFVDLCRGPHVKSSSDVGVVKLKSVAGAYWRGKQENAQLQRVYGYAFPTQEDLDAHLKMLEEAEKRDHRKLGKELKLFALIDEVGGGLPLFYPRGAVLRREVEAFITEMQEKRGYVPIWIPHITKSRLYEISGHLQKYDALYPPMELPGEDKYYIKPMNCPHFMMLYKQDPHSYRELPIRFVCTTTNYRYEKSGELSGLTRVRSLTQDDCHVFARPDQIGDEINLMLDMIEEAYGVFDFKDFWVRISTHDPKDKDKYIGAPEVWEESEAALKRLIEARGWKHAVGVGEAAFYGPKLDFMAKDVIGREWQLTTIQLDMNLPERFELEYADSDGQKKRPVVIHRAILGSTERFLGIYIEHVAGVFPTWLSPEQVALLPVGEKHVEACEALQAKLWDLGLRPWLDASGESVGKKVRNAEKMKIPYSLVLGDKEIPADGGWKDDVKLAVRLRGSKDPVEMTLGEFVARLQEETRTRKGP